MMIYSENFRMEIYVEYIDIQNKIADLKSIVQNEMYITADDLVQQKKIGVEIKSYIDKLQKRLEIGE